MISAEQEKPEEKCVTRCVPPHVILCVFYFLHLYLGLCFVLSLAKQTRGCAAWGLLL